MDANSFQIYSEIGGTRVCPTAGVVVDNAVPLATQWLVGVTTENPVDMFEARMRKGAVRHLGGEAEPAGIQAIQETGETLSGEVNLLEDAGKIRRGRLENY
jgi:hypothetical protein